MNGSNEKTRRTFCSRTSFSSSNWLFKMVSSSSTAFKASRTTMTWGGNCPDSSESLAMALGGVV
jgi:hypothetical protein